MAGRGLRIVPGLIAAVLLLLLPIGCDEDAGAGVESVKIGGQWFHLELATDPTTRTKGLSGRTFIEPDGGMLFVFPQPRRLNFVMRDCPVPIDIIFLDASGRVVAKHAMEPEEPRKADEGLPGQFNANTKKYEDRLKKYPSRLGSQFVIELAGGTLEGLTLEQGQRIDLDLDRLKELAK
jgi:uncharacterized membrane protein (UPF0127 family)